MGQCPGRCTKYDLKIKIQGVGGGCSAEGCMRTLVPQNQKSGGKCKTDFESIKLRKLEMEGVR